MFGVDLLADIQNVVIAGSGSADQGGAAYIYANLDADRLTTILAGNATFSSTDYDGLKLLSWVDDNDKKAKYASFARPGLAVMSDKKEAVTAALDVLSGKTAGISADSPLKSAFASDGAFLTVMAVDVPSIIGEQPKGQALRQAQSLCLRVSASQPDLISASLAVKAASEETALQIRQALMGIQALAQLTAAVDLEVRVRRASPRPEQSGNRRPAPPAHDKDGDVAQAGESVEIRDGEKNRLRRRLGEPQGGVPVDRWSGLCPTRTRADVRRVRADATGTPTSSARRRRRTSPNRTSRPFPIPG